MLLFIVRLHPSPEARLSDFVKNVRLRKAAELLKEGGLTIAEIADKVGFNTPSYFTKFIQETVWGVAYTI